MGLELVPVYTDEAAEFARVHHRHLPRVAGHILCLGAAKDGRVVGVAVVARPVARLNCDGYTCELTRLATDGTRNAASFLLRRAWRAAQAIGYRRMVTYTLDTEPGTSLRAAGFRFLGHTPPGRRWNTPSRPRVDTSPAQRKLRWEVTE